jgi:hypothetical protein
MNWGSVAKKSGLPQGRSLIGDVENCLRLGSKLGGGISTEVGLRRNSSGKVMPRLSRVSTDSVSFFRRLR